MANDIETENTKDATDDDAEDSDEEDNDQTWAIDNCQICQEIDTPEHALYGCPPVRKIWTDGLAILKRLLPESDLRPSDNLDINLKNIVLCFPEARQNAPKERRARYSMALSNNLHHYANTHAAQRPFGGQENKFGTPTSNGRKMGILSQPKKSCLKSGE
jgi:hypothetical protein